MGIMLFIFGSLLNKDLEKGQTKVNLRENLVTTYKAFKLPEIYQICIFFLINGLFKPSFENFTYYFLMDIIGIQKITYSLLVFIG